MAESLFNTRAGARNVGWEAASAGTEPSPAVSPAVVELLTERNLPAPAHAPRRVTVEQMDAAECVVSLGCRPEELPARVDDLEMWDDVPLPGADLTGSYAAIQRHVDELLDHLETIA